MASFFRLHGPAVLILAFAPAQPLPAAEAAFAPEVQQRLELLRTGYETFVLNNCTLPYDAGVKALNARAKPLLERESAAAAQRTDLDTLARAKADLERLGKGQLLTAAAAAPPEALKHAYAAYKLELSRLETMQKASLADAKQRYDRGLEQVQNELTQAQEVKGALQVKQMREALAGAQPPALPASGPSPAGGGSPENLLVNGSFQKGTKMWDMNTHEPRSNPTMVVDKKALFQDKATLRVRNPVLTDTHVVQTVKVRPNTRYRLSGFIKAQDITDAKGHAASDPAVKVNGGACLSIPGPRRDRSSFVTADTWTEVSLEFQTQDETELGFECRLGYFGATVSGTAWFAGLSMTEISAAAPAAAAAAVPQFWTYHMKATDTTSLANIALKPDGEFTMSSMEPGRWEQSRTDGTITISFADRPGWKMTLNGDGTAMLDRPDTGRRYMRVRR